MEGYEHVELFLVFHGVVDGDDRGGDWLIANVDYYGIASLDPAAGGPSDYEEIVG